MGSLETGNTRASSDAVTLVITTSPTPSAPSTELLCAILESFRTHCTELLTCRIIVVLDTFERIGLQPRLKKGQVTKQGAKDVDDYKTNVKNLILEQYWPHEEKPQLSSSTHEAEFGYEANEANHISVVATHTPDGRITFLEPTRRLGFGLAVRSALRLTETPYVWIQQHDWSLVTDVPLGGILDVMRRHECHESSPVKYVCLPSVRMLGYATSGHVTNFPTLKSLTAELRKEFAVPSTTAAGKTETIPLTPMFFWHDKPHIASTEHYLSRVFPTRLAIPRGAFIEDTIGQRGRNQMKEGQWTRWACWLYYPDDGQTLCLRHLQGRTWRGTEGDLEHGQHIHQQSGALLTTRVACVI
ncbi:uncharacterized protein B0I36DRAFT_425317 [Microdochium trichocladiopsis]|uniref:Uncharacterized protein n=1 Tax=Microdochium trichocladiopsis TaxID=1682393 RepID=A0A9P9BMX3_9PEZI|nr:uncharacterized protein B0I36DRAFT_425317 [Microdochium trichocladiopsis]KAH7018242.1 hypothetical protein B0I36DRAFT_425317 [Microdochium trichocladiopsis]